MVDVAGRQPVLEALRSGQEINKLLWPGYKAGCAPGDQALAKRRA